MALRQSFKFSIKVFRDSGIRSFSKKFSSSNNRSSDCNLCFDKTADRCNDNNNENLKLEGLNVAITGGYGGIGRETCRALLDKNIASLAILDVMEDKSFLCEIQNRFPEKKIFDVPMEITSRENVQYAVDSVINQMKHIDVFINSSGILADQCPEETISINLMGTVNTTLVAMDHMAKNKNGRGGLIVNVASVLGFEPCNAFAVYAASKHGQIGLTRSLADDFYFKKTGVKLMMICPGITETVLIQKPSTTFNYGDELGGKFFSAASQKADICGINLVKAIEKNKNGSMWILDLGKLTEVVPTQHWQPTYREITSCK